MHCSIIIRAYNEEKHLGRLLDGISRQTIREVEMVLVDSGSTDSAEDIATSYRATVAPIVPDNFTFGRSLNIGTEAATAPIIVIASAHIYPVYPDWLERLLAPFSDTKIALTYGRQRGDELRKFSEHQIFAQGYP
jgi:rhamnosyltransferase